MICNHNFRVLSWLSVFIFMIFFPFQLSAQETEQVIEHEAGFYYTIQKGDTLWDLSTRFSDSPWLWPDLWKENSQIPNPHRIYPGERIRLFHQRGVEEHVIETAEIEAAPKEEPPKEEPYYYYSPINRIGFVRKTPITPSGYIFKVKDVKSLISTGDLVYLIQQGDQPYKLKGKYTVYRTLKPLVDKKKRERIGIQHYMTGVVEIIKKEPRFAIAKVVQSYRGIQVNDLLIPYQKRSPEITLAFSKPGLQGKIIKTEERDNIIGEGAVVFIDKGQQDGVKIGQSYSIYYQEKHQIDPKSKQAVLLTPVDYGTLLVLHTEPTASTVLITRSERTIYPGDTFRSLE